MSALLKHSLAGSSHWQSADIRQLPANADTGKANHREDKLRAPPLSAPFAIEITTTFKYKLVFMCLVPRHICRFLTNGGAARINPVYGVELLLPTPGIFPTSKEL